MKGVKTQSPSWVDRGKALAAAQRKAGAVRPQPPAELGAWLRREHPDADPYEFARGYLTAWGDR